MADSGIAGRALLLTCIGIAVIALVQPIGGSRWDQGTTTTADQSNIMTGTDSMAAPAADVVDLGPARISMNLQGIGQYKLAKDDPSTMNHNYGGYGFTYQAFQASIASDNTSNQALIEVYQMSVPEPLDVSIPLLNTKTGLEHAVEKSDIMPPGRDIQRQPYYIDGQKGIAMTVNNGQREPVYVAAYSPDMQNGFGKVIIIIASNFPLDTTKQIFESLKTQFGHDNMRGQSNTGMGTSNTGMSGMGQSNMGQSSMMM